MSNTKATKVVPALGTVPVAEWLKTIKASTKPTAGPKSYLNYRKLVMPKG